MNDNMPNDQPGRDWTKNPPATEQDWYDFNYRTTRYKAEDRHERAVLLWEDYELLLNMAQIKTSTPPTRAG